MLKKLKAYADDGLALGGCVCILIGLAQLNPSVAWVAAGLMCYGAAWLYGRYA